MADPSAKGPTPVESPYTVRGVPKPLVPNIHVHDEDSRSTRREAPRPRYSERGKAVTPGRPSLAGRVTTTTFGWIAGALTGQRPTSAELRDPSSPASRRARVLGWIVVGLAAFIVALVLLIVYLSTPSARPIN